ncbi:MAG: MiaB/RimO family radical SAM methylthiotransferase [Candidatus Omnitrophica bacterium]|nr:MiaB/RimO family radical SAM methylthiotransferase [Candidatus Omnitrophota bacterium]
MLKMKKVFIYSNGCYTNRIEAKGLERLFKGNGWTCSDRAKDADFILFETCAFNKEKEDECISTIARFAKEKNRGAQLIVCGCLPKINKKRLRDNFKGLCLDPSTLSSLGKLVPVKEGFQDISKSQYLFDDHYQGDALYIKISSGCMDRCAYCAVKNVFPKLVSRPKKEILEEFRRSLKDGNRNFCITAEDIGCYGLDIGTDLVGLLEDIVRLKGRYSIILRRLNPSCLKRIGRGLVDIIDSKRIRYICTPAQSGSDKVLRLMNRKYSVAEFRDFIKKARDGFSLLKIKTDFMVGFPGETEEDFRKSLDLVLESRFDKVLAFKFSKRTNTIAWGLKDCIPEEIKDARQRNIVLAHKLSVKTLTNS